MARMSRACSEHRALVPDRFPVYLSWPFCVATIPVDSPSSSKPGLRRSGSPCESRSVHVWFSVIEGWAADLVFRLSRKTGSERSSQGDAGKWPYSKGVLPILWKPLPTCTIFIGGEISCPRLYNNDKHRKGGERSELATRRLYLWLYVPRTLLLCKLS